MKRIIAILLSMILFLTGCSHLQVQQQVSLQSSEIISDSIAEQAVIDMNDWENGIPQYDSLDDTELLQYVEDNIYAELAIQFSSDDYIIENVTAAYISQEYLDEVTFNSRSNVLFGYTTAELDDFFKGTRYIFTLGDDERTVVQEMQIIEDKLTEKIIKNIAIGTGVILVCVTVSYFTAGTGTPTAVNLIFIAAAKSGTAFALSSGIIGGISAGIVKGYQTGDMNEALETAAFVGSEEFKWGAITGTIIGGSSKTLSIYRSTKVTPTYRQSELDVLDMTDNAVEQISYLDGKKVNSNLLGTIRPDVIVQNSNGTIKAIEVKNYNLKDSDNLCSLLSVLKRQIAERIKHLPEGSTQEIVLDVRGRGYSTKFLDKVVSYIQKGLEDIYTDIPVNVLRY